MRCLKVLLVLVVLFAGLLMSCTKQELNEEGQIINETDKPKIRRPGNGD